APAMNSARFVYTGFADKNCLGGALGFGFGDDRFVFAFLFFGDRRDADRRARRRLFGGFLRQFAQLFGLLGRRERFSAAAATALFLFAGDGGGQFGQRFVVFDVDDFDARSLAGHVRAVLYFNDARAEHSSG